MAEHWEHITTEGERWDALAYRYYGDPHRYEPLITANPDVPIVPLLPSGIKLRVPVIEIPDTLPAEELPPWKR